MKLIFALSGTNIFTTEADCVPPPGSQVVMRTQQYKKGIHAGSLVRFPIPHSPPALYDYSDGSLTVYIDADEIVILKSGPNLNPE